MDFNDLTVDTVWMNGSFIDWEDANIHALSQVATSGAGVFEGSRSYPTNRGHAIFRLEAHMNRLENSANMLNMGMEYDTETVSNITKRLARMNGLDASDGSFYTRHSISYGYHDLMDPSSAPVDHFIVMFPFGRLWGDNSVEDGIEVMISPWRRLHSSQFPLQAKTTGIYVLSRLSRREAQTNGYDDALLLNMDGTVAEGTNANIVVVNDETLFTPGLESSILPGITRRTILRIARDRGYDAVEGPITTGELLTADEAFFCGTGAEVTPIRKVNDTLIGDGTRGPVTEDIQRAYLDVTHGECEAYDDWLQFV